MEPKHATTTNAFATHLIFIEHQNFKRFQPIGKLLSLNTRNTDH